MPPPIYQGLRDRIADVTQELVPFLAEAYRVTTDYGAPIAAGPDKGKPHYGIDYGTPKGTPLYASGTGVVLRPTDNPSGGSTTGGDDEHTITVDYGNGLIMQFAHLDKVYVKPGDTIAPGDWIGDTGDYGIGTGAHLHVAAWRAGRLIDPREVFDPLTDFRDYESVPGATAGSIPILGPATGAARGAADTAATMANAVVEFVGTVINPETWARVFAIIGGAILTMIGGYMLWQST